MLAGTAGRPWLRAQEAAWIRPVIAAVIWRPAGARVALGGVFEVAQQVSAAQLVDQRAELGVVIDVVAVVDDYPGQVRQHELAERGDRAVTEHVIGQQGGAGDQKLPLAPRRAGARTQRGLIAAHHMRGDDQRPDQLVRRSDRGSGPGQHAVHEPGRRPGAGQRLDQLGAPVHRHRMGHHQVHTPGLQVRPVGDRARRARAGRGGRLADGAAAAPHNMPVVLDHPRAHQRDLDLLMRAGHAEVLTAAQAGAASAPAPRQHRDTLVRIIVPGQMRPRRSGLLARIACPVRRLAPGPGRPLAARLAVHRRRERGVPAVTRQQPLQPLHPRLQRTDRGLLLADRGLLRRDHHIAGRARRAASRRQQRLGHSPPSSGQSDCNQADTHGRLSTT